MCVALKAPSRSAGPALPCRHRALGAAEPGGLGGSSARPGGQSGGERGAGGGLPSAGGGRRAARRSRSGPRPRSPAGQDRERPQREAQLQLAPVCPAGSYLTPGAGEAASPEGAGGRRRPRGGGCEPRAPYPAGRPRALSSLPSPRRASSSCLCRLISSARRRSRPRPGPEPSWAGPPVLRALGQAPRGPVPRRTPPLPRGPAASGPFRPWTERWERSRRPRSPGLGCADPRCCPGRRRRGSADILGPG